MIAHDDDEDDEEFSVLANVIFLFIGQFIFRLTLYLFQLPGEMHVCNSCRHRQINVVKKKTIKLIKHKVRVVSIETVLQ